jgi:hypothetical protein
MFVEEVLGDGLRCGVDLKGLDGHLGDDLEGKGVLDGLWA